jgi:hypothetical protein
LYLCWLSFHDPERSVGAVHAGSALGIVKPDSQHAHTFAAQCGQRTTGARSRRGNAPGQHLTTHLGRRL